MMLHDQHPKLHHKTTISTDGKNVLPGHTRSTYGLFAAQRRGHSRFRSSRRVGISTQRSGWISSLLSMSRILAPVKTPDFFMVKLRVNHGSDFHGIWHGDDMVMEIWILDDYFLWALKWWIFFMSFFMEFFMVISWNRSSTWGCRTGVK